MAEEKVVIQLRIAPSHKRLLEAAAKSMGLSLSAWLRMVALKAAKEQRAESK